MAASSTSTAIKEPTFEVSDFNSPKEVENADAWIRLIAELIFLEKGTYSDSPDAGVQISDYEFNELVEGKSHLQTEINSQCSQYLSDIPIGVLEVSSFYWEEKNQYVVQVLVGFVEGSVLTYRAIHITDEDKTLTYLISKYDEK